MTNKLNGTIEVWCDRKTKAPPEIALIFPGWFSPGHADAADEHYRIVSPDGVCWHVLVFDGEIGKEKARTLVHRAFDGNGVRRIDLTVYNVRP